MSVNLCWLRNDLRIHDNTALWHASQNGAVVAVYLITPGTWAEHDEAAVKVDFWLRNLVELGRALEALNIPLKLVEVDHWRDAPQALLNVARDVDATGMFFNDEYGIHEQRRDQAVAEEFRSAGLACQRFVDNTLFEPGTLLTQSGSMYKVYSQFRKQAYANLHRALPQCLPAPSRQGTLAVTRDTPPEKVAGFEQVTATIQQIWPAGERAASDRLDLFVADILEDYQDTRDRPDLDGTSRLSPYLASGIISVRQCLHAAIGANRGEFDSGNTGAVGWINELLWREFYRHILVCYPHVSRGKAFRSEYQDFRWRTEPDALRAWQTGNTGIPIVDAAMRQMLATGWMHNRLRMITAMFLTKNLLINWQDGERWFMRHLIDGDFASNNGGWQWSASTGTDSAPYFRVFNPMSQAEKFDPDAGFIREWVPELRSLSPREIHRPLSSSQLAELGYPEPIVDLKASRQRAIEAFRGG
ncbi:deoxyribodipyrimidine photo-lyase [Halopseudomonas nanhaiensis]|uniref:deoxyribodipyrimidine photo-lyase n=1 Tax=Halopseudomonas nanhaiensis TaxID=2830842 RepID=UPI001CBDA4BD|nr:deoxyribodipyrimidine photo-lyase [Halopseudomonas nanhaiensis]UAW97917.1 deoxyribodipyrimidine photo-lyase [Halopseudomonas nanhaiensis]